MSTESSATQSLLVLPTLLESVGQSLIVLWHLQEQLESLQEQLLALNLYTLWLINADT